MSGTTAVQGLSVKIEISASFVAIPNVTAVNLPSIDPGVFECPALNQVGLGIPRKATGLVDAKGFSIEGYFQTETTSHQRLITVALTAIEATYQVELSNGDVWEQDIAGNKFEQPIAMKEGIKFKVGGDCNGLPAYTAA